jgi:hypothetical protein
MSKRPTRKPDSEMTGVDDVRRVREKIAALYNGDIRKHMEDTQRIVEPLSKKLGLKRVAIQPSRAIRAGVQPQREKLSRKKV